MAKSTKRRAGARRKKPSKTQPSFLLRILQECCSRGHLRADDRAFVQRWRDRQAEKDDWSPIQKWIEQRNPDVWADDPRGTEEVYVQQVITARRLATLCIGKRNSLLELSMMAKTLAAYLKGPGPELPRRNPRS